MAKKKKRSLRDRTLRRQAERSAHKLLKDRERLAKLSAGGSAERPEEVATAALIEPRATTEPCLRCGETMRVAEHEAAEHGGQLLRVVNTRCGHCGHARRWFFRLVAPIPN